MAKYTAEIFGHSWRQGPIAEFDTVREARAWAQSYGTTADSCTIVDRKGREVGLHMRDTGGRGLRWFRARHSPMTVIGSLAGITGKPE